jgi:hypothetical protein
MQLVNLTLCLGILASLVRVEQASLQGPAATIPMCESSRAGVNAAVLNSFDTYNQSLRASRPTSEPNSSH